MAAPVPVLCQGTTFSFNAIALGGVIGMSGLGSGKAKEIDVTTLASTAKEFLPGLKDSGGFTLDLIRNGDDVGQIELLVELAAQLPKVMIVTLPTSTNNIATFTCFVTSLTSDASADGVVMGKAEFRITGAIVWS
jgi:hypothetical protein